MMYEQQQRLQQPVERTTYSNNSNLIEETERLEIVNLSGMSLDSLPNPSLNLASICKLDLSNNNIQVFLNIMFGNIKNNFFIYVQNVYSN